MTEIRMRKRWGVVAIGSALFAGTVTFYYAVSVNFQIAWWKYMLPLIGSLLLCIWGNLIWRYGGSV